MAEGNLYYWIKLRTDFFDSDTIDFLMSQKNGADYVVLYQMLCLKTVNTDGGLYSEMGEVVVPYDVNKIARITKYFNVDTVRVALELYKKLGLVYVREDGILRLTGYESMVGTAKTDDKTRLLTAERQRRYRERQKSVTVTQDVTETVTSLRNEEIEIRDRDKSIEIDNTQKENISKEKARFSKPTLEEAQAYITEKGYSVNAEQWFNFYETNGWKVGRNPMKDWKASIRYWNTSGYSKPSTGDGINHGYNKRVDLFNNDDGEENPWK